MKPRCPNCNSPWVKHENDESMSVDGRMMHWSTWSCIWCKHEWVMAELGKRVETVNA